MNKTALIMAMLGITVLVTMWIAACGDNRTDPAEFAVKRGEESGGLTYHVLDIEGMTCIWVKTGCGDGGCGGLTCNWDEWRK